MGGLTKTAHEAWNSSNTGSFKIGQIHASKDKKIVVLQRSLKHRTLFVAFPKIKDMKEFEQASYSVLAKGAAEENRGGIGTLELQTINPEIVQSGQPLPGSLGTQLSEVLYVRHVQAHYKTGPKKPALQRKLATFYGGWRRRVFCQALEHAKNTKKAFVVAKSNKNFERLLTPSQKRKKTQFRKELEIEGKHAGLTWHENAHFIVLHHHGHEKQI